MIEFFFINSLLNNKGDAFYAERFFFEISSI